MCGFVGVDVWVCGCGCECVHVLGLCQVVNGVHECVGGGGRGCVAGVCVGL